MEGVCVWGIKHCRAVIKIKVKVCKVFRAMPGISKAAHLLLVQVTLSKRDYLPGPEHSHKLMCLLNKLLPTNVNPHMRA